MIEHVILKLLETMGDNVLGFGQVYEHDFCFCVPGFVAFFNLAVQVTVGSIPGLWAPGLSLQWSPLICLCSLDGRGGA